jgi:hypothetical protein
MASSFTRFLDHTQGRNTFGKTPLDEWSDHLRDLYLTTHNNHKGQTSMPPVGFEPAIPASERPQTNALVRSATGIGAVTLRWINKRNWYNDTAGGEGWGVNGRTGSMAGPTAAVATANVTWKGLKSVSSQRARARRRIISVIVGMDGLGIYS